MSITTFSRTIISECHADGTPGSEATFRTIFRHTENVRDL
jgi:hypothetical protein